MSPLTSNQKQQSCEKLVIVVGNSWVFEILVLVVLVLIPTTKMLPLLRKNLHKTQWHTPNKFIFFYPYLVPKSYMKKSYLETQQVSLQSPTMTKTKTFHSPPCNPPPFATTTMTTPTTPTTTTTTNILLTKPKVWTMCLETFPSSISKQNANPKPKQHHMNLFLLT